VKKFIYVEARNVRQEDGSSLVSFDHVAVEATDEDDAYAGGPVALAAQQREDVGRPNDDDRGVVIRQHVEGDLLNDYVVEV
jgi:hypothetical protein